MPGTMVPGRGFIFAQEVSMRKLLLVLCSSLPLMAAEFGISTQDIELSFMEQEHLELTTSASLAFTFSDADVFDAPGQLQADLRWLNLEGPSVALNFLSGVYWGFVMASDGEFDFTSTNVGISPLKLEPEAEINQTVSVFLTATMLAYDFEEKRLRLGVYSDTPAVEVGIRWQLAD
jgi:hypothetical protein